MVRLARPVRWPARLGITALVLVLVVGVGGALWWFVWVPNWRPGLEDGERYGIDVSHHQGAIDWPAVAADEISFAYLKATEGGDWVDPRFTQNWAGAARAGLDLGAYHFFSLCTPAGEQARHFLDTAPPDPGALAPAVDLELAGNCADRPGRGNVADEVASFLAIVEAAWNRPVVLYVGDDWQEVYPVTVDRPQWTLRFLRRPDGDWHLWQLHGFSNVDGIGGSVDLDVMRTERPPVAGRSGRSRRRTG